MKLPSWSDLTPEEKFAIIQPKLIDGWSYRDISKTFYNATTNMVLSFCYRHGLNHRNAHVFVYTQKIKPRSGPRKPYQKKKRVKKTRPIRSTDPFTIKVLELVQFSNLPDYQITERAGVYKSALNDWRTGRRNASPFLGQCVMEAAAVLAGFKTPELMLQSYKEKEKTE